MYELQVEAHRLNDVQTGVAAEGLMEIRVAEGRGMVGQTAAA